MEEKMYTDAEVMTVMAWTANEVLKNYSKERNKIMNTGVTLGFLIGVASTFAFFLYQVRKKEKEEHPIEEAET